MNILFYCSEYPPFRSGGIGSVTKIVAEKLVQRGHNVTVVGYYFSLPRKKLVESINGVTIYRFGLGLRNSWFKQKIIQVCNKLHLAKWIYQYEINYIESQLEKLIDELSIDVLELPDYYPLVSCKNILKFRKFGVPTILRIHGSVTFVNELAGYCPQCYKTNDRLHFNRCDHILAVSNFSVNFIRDRFNLPNVRSWDVIYNSVEDSVINPTNCVDNNTIIFIGRLTKEKGCISLMKAFNLCADQDESIRLKLLGNGDREVLLGYLNPKYHDRVEFLGYCDRKKVTEAIDKCSFGCIPSYFESFSMAILEIMSRRRTVIFTERASGRELIRDGINGLVVDPDNVQQLSEKMLFLASNHTKRDEMAEQAFEDVKNRYSSTVIVSQLENYYTNKMCNQLKR